MVRLTACVAWPLVRLRCHHAIALVLVGRRPHQRRHVLVMARRNVRTREVVSHTQSRRHVRVSSSCSHRPGTDRQSNTEQNIDDDQPAVLRSCLDLAAHAISDWERLLWRILWIGCPFAPCSSERREWRVERGARGGNRTLATGPAALPPRWRVGAGWPVRVCARAGHAHAAAELGLRGPGACARRCGAGAPRSRGYKFPRRSCSISRASKSALKLPLPKDCEPRREMISKKSVGRSCSGFVKSWSR